MKLLKPDSAFWVSSIIYLLEKRQQRALREHRIVSGNCRFQKMGGKVKGRERKKHKKL